MPVNKKYNDEYLECEKQWIFILLMIASGFLGAFTYKLRGGVFSNAQTGNILYMALALGEARWGDALYYLIPISAYLLGAVISEAIAGPIKRLHIIRWDTLFVMIEMLTVVVLAVLPESVPFQISQVMVNFICSMQYNTFRQAQSVPMATTFCTGHTRELGTWLSRALRHRDKKAASRALKHGLMILAFAGGVTSGAILCDLFSGKAAFFALIPLAIVLIDFLNADLNTEKDMFDRVPHGHPRGH